MKDICFFHNKLQFHAWMDNFFSSENTISLNLIHNEHTHAVICIGTLRRQMHTPYFKCLFLVLII